MNNNNCPYCGNDTYVGKDVSVNQQYYNKCLSCGEWSLFSEQDGQKELPNDINKEDLENILNNS